MIEKTKDVYVPSLGRVGVVEKGTSTENIRREVMDGREMKILPASVWESFPWPEMRLLLHETGTYVVPTEELVDYLDKLIGEESAIEICAGNGFIGRELGIPVTDSYQQQDDFGTSVYYQLAGQPTIKYPKDVIKMEANKAVDRFRPHTVLACYATHKWRYDTMSGNDKGVDFNKLIRKVKRLILVGNTEVHKDNPLMKIPHEEIILPGLITRSAHPETNRIYIWEN